MCYLQVKGHVQIHHSVSVGIISWQYNYIPALPGEYMVIVFTTGPVSHAFYQCTS